MGVGVGVGVGVGDGVGVVRGCRTRWNWESWLSAPLHPRVVIAKKSKDERKRNDRIICFPELWAEFLHVYQMVNMQVRMVVQ